jgi:hypothetical protein
MRKDERPWTKNLHAFNIFRRISCFSHLKRRGGWKEKKIDLKRLRWFCGLYHNYCSVKIEHFVQNPWKIPCPPLVLPLLLWNKSLGEIQQKTAQIAVTTIKFQTETVYDTGRGGSIGMHNTGNSFWKCSLNPNNMPMPSTENVNMWKSRGGFLLPGIICRMFTNIFPQLQLQNYRFFH